MIERIGREPVNERELFLAQVAGIDAWPAEIDSPQPHFVAFIAIDATGVDDASLFQLGERLLSQGAAYVCAWGPACQRVHDQIDAARDVDLLDDESMVMTTWHDDEPLDEALWFALYAACPSDRYIETCGSVLAIVFANEGWSQHVRAALAEPADLVARVVH